MERGFYNVGLLCSLFGQFFNLIMSIDVCVGSDFADVDIVVGGFQHIYCLGYEELI